MVDSGERGADQYRRGESRKNLSIDANASTVAPIGPTVGPISTGADGARIERMR